MAHRTRIGHSDIEIAPFALGANVFGWTADRDATFAVLDAFVAGGGDFVDTADSYARWVPGNTGGESETLIGEWIAGTPGGVNLLAITYLNRLSDLLFILARATTQAAGETLWVPGKDREALDPAARAQRARIVSQQAAVERSPGNPAPGEQPPTS